MPGNGADARQCISTRVSLIVFSAASDSCRASWEHVMNGNFGRRSV